MADLFIVGRVLLAKLKQARDRIKLRKFHTSQMNQMQSNELESEEINIQIPIEREAEFIESKNNSKLSFIINFRSCQAYFRLEKSEYVKSAKSFSGIN